MHYFTSYRVDSFFLSCVLAQAGTGGQPTPKFGRREGGAPPQPVARQNCSFYIVVSFLSMEGPKNEKIAGLKPGRKVDLWVPYVSLYHERHR